MEISVWTELGNVLQLYNWPICIDPAWRWSGKAVLTVWAKLARCIYCSDGQYVCDLDKAIWRSTSTNHVNRQVDVMSKRMEALLCIWKEALLITITVAVAGPWRDKLVIVLIVMPSAVVVFIRSIALDDWNISGDIYCHATVPTDGHHPLEREPCIYYK